MAKEKVNYQEVYDLYQFFAKHVKLVYYHYNNGSRASDVAKTFLEHFMGLYPLTDIRFTECTMEKTQRW